MAINLKHYSCDYCGKSSLAEEEIYNVTIAHYSDDNGPYISTKIELCKDCGNTFNFHLAKKHDVPIIDPKGFLDTLYNVLRKQFTR